MILVTGCTGFVGTHLVNKLVDEGFEVKCLARGTSNLDRLPAGRLIFAVGDVMNVESLLEAAEGVDTVVHLVGIIREKGEATFERIHVEGTRNTIEAAKAQGVRRFIYQSAIGAREDGITRYQTTKWQAEELTRASGLEWIVVRPSVIIGKWGEFVQVLVDLVKKPPVILVIGSGEYKLQPVYVGDLTQAFLHILRPVAPSPSRPVAAWNRVYELGGPEKLTFNRMLQVAQEVLGVRKPMIHLPVGLMRPLVRGMEAVTSRFPISADQLAMLSEDSVTDHNAFTEVFGIEPTPFAEALRQSF